MSYVLKKIYYLVQVFIHDNFENTLVLQNTKPLFYAASHRAGNNPILYFSLAPERGMMSGVIYADTSKI